MDLLIRIILSLDLGYIRVISTQVRTGVVWHFLTKCTDVDKIENIEVHLIEQVEEGDYYVERNCDVGKTIVKPNCSLCHMV